MVQYFKDEAALRGCTVVIQGDPGCGKTTLACDPFSFGINEIEGYAKSLPADAEGILY